MFTKQTDLIWASEQWATEPDEHGRFYSLERRGEWWVLFSIGGVESKRLGVLPRDLTGEVACRLAMTHIEVRSKYERQSDSG